MHRLPNKIYLLFYSLTLFAGSITADVGTAAYYSPPYLPTNCFGSDASQFPPNNLFAAAGEGVWDNGASCGREYLVRCLSSATPGGCVEDGPTIQVTIVDQADALFNSLPSFPGTTLVLSQTAFGMIADSSSAMEINIEFTEYDTVLYDQLNLLCCSSPGYCGVVRLALSSKILGHMAL